MRFASRFYGDLEPVPLMGKVKDFLGIMAEANKRLQLDARDKSEDYDIEALTGNESEYIEMDLMLGVADLHTPEAVAAAESAVAFYQTVIPLAADNCLTESDDSSGDDNHDDKATCSPTKLKRTKPTEDQFSGETPKNHKSKKRSKIIELS
ncbi:hypothetical protein RJ639_046992 [Escallonia herrerae]|uniref:Uncharacterized protein n=1 Tax=Escallonia herrerae TaxID=1293975 RepID=A0AA89B2N9_9ASTE|nr:hypothetical protein RJ639_046992 [Escallonia herrerae]